MSQNQNKRTLRTIGLVVAVTLLTKILGIVREALQAGVFGTQTAFDLYTISYNYTIYIFTTVAYALCIAAVPVISRHLAEDRNKAFAVAGNLICVSVLVSALVVGLASIVIHFAPVGHWLGVSDADLPTLRMYLADLRADAAADRDHLPAGRRVPVHGALYAAGQPESAV